MSKTNDQFYTYPQQKLLENIQATVLRDQLGPEPPSGLGRGAGHDRLARPEREVQQSRKLIEDIAQSTAEELWVCCLLGCVKPTLGVGTPRRMCDTTRAQPGHASNGGEVAEKRGFLAAGGAKGTSLAVSKSVAVSESLEAGQLPHERVCGILDNPRQPQRRTLV